jgi:photosystem II stability/assembly factor-like uncharacterized protein
MDSLSSLSTTNKPTAKLLPPSTSTLAPTRTPRPTPRPVQLVWQRLSIGVDFPRNLVTEIVVNPANPKIMFFGAREDTYGTQTYLSIDQGQSWQEISAPGYSLIYNADGTILYRGERNKILFSKDDGKTWNVLSPPVNGTINVATHPLDPAILFALYKNRTNPIFFSEDGGGTWTNAMGSQSSGKNFPQLFFSQDGNVIYSSMGPSLSADGGRSWHGCGVWDFSTDMAISLDPELTSAMVVDPKNSDNVYTAVGSSGIRITRNGCQSWNRIDRGLSDQRVNTITIDPNSFVTLYAGTANNGAYRSINGGSLWEPINNGLPAATVVYSIVVDSQSNVYMATSDGPFILVSK